MNNYTTLLLLLGAIPSFSQASKEPLGNEFIEKTIEYYYTTEARKHRGTSTFYIEKDSLNMGAKTDYGAFRVQFLTVTEASEKMKKTNMSGSRLDRINVKWISLDTIDVVITGCTVGQRKVNKIVDQKTVTATENFLTNCTEAWVNLPTCRFVYDLATTGWTQLNRGKSVKKN